MTTRNTPLVVPEPGELDRPGIDLGGGLRETVRFFQQQLAPEWEIYVRPHLNGARPDLVLLNPNTGIAVFQVAEWSLRPGDYSLESRPGQLPTKLLCREKEDSWARRANPLEYAHMVRDVTFNLYAPSLRRTGGCSAFAVVTSGVIFPNACAEEIADFLKVCGWMGDPKYMPVSAGDSLRRGTIGRVFPEHARRYSRYMGESAAEELRAWLREPEHCASGRIGLRLDRAQEKLATSRTSSGFRRLRGPAGSGKTQVLAARAANLEARGKRVLILTFNLTLMRNFRDLLARARLPHRHGDNITVFGFHYWCRLACWEAGLREQYRAIWQNCDKQNIMDRALPALAEQALEELPGDEPGWASGYDALLVDEAQDWLPEWWRMACKAVRTDGERVLVADATQDLYGKRDAWTDEAMTGAGMKGDWSRLRTSHRIPADVLPHVTEFGTRYLNDVDRDLPENRELGLGEPTRMRWWQVEPGQAAVHAANAVTDLVPFSRNDPAVYSDVVVVAQNRRLGREIVAKLNELGFHCQHTFQDDDEAQRHAKRSFCMGEGGIKCTTVHSIKGWEARYLIVCVEKCQRPRDMVALYVALSRIKASDTGVGSHLTMVCADNDLIDYGCDWSEYADRRWRIRKTEAKGRVA